MANELTRQLQLRELEILIELDRVCKEENLTYFLEGERCSARFGTVVLFRGMTISTC